MKMNSEGIHVSQRALSGVRVVDFGWVYAVPCLTKILAVMGAQVIKVEPKSGDITRRIPPFFKGQWGINRAGYFNTLNYNKLGITLDLKQPKGLEIAKRLIAISDIVTENFSLGVIERMGLGYSDLKEIKPDIIMISISGFGKTGPDKDKVVYGTGSVPFFGLSSMTGYIGGPPQNLRTAYGDDLACLQGVIAVLCALYYRSRRGKGQYLDLSMMEAGAVSVPEGFMEYIMTGRQRKPMGNRDDFMAPHGCYRCKGDDKWVAIGVSSQEEWQGFCQALGNPEWVSDERFQDAFSRWNNQDEMDRLIEQWTANHTHYEVTEILQAAGVAATPVLNSEELLADPHLKHRDFFVETDHPEMGRIKELGIPWKMSQTPPRVWKSAPLLGEDNEYVLSKILGMSKQEINTLLQDKVI